MNISLRYEADSNPQADSWVDKIIARRLLAKQKKIIPHILFTVNLHLSKWLR